MDVGASGSCVFFFKQKTAYEMRISDWSSDVCSSDLKSAITRNFDSGLEYVLIAMIRSSEIGPDGEVRLIEPLGDQRFLEPYSGLYWQISGGGQEPYRDRKSVV